MEQKGLKGFKVKPKTAYTREYAQSKFQSKCMSKFSIKIQLIKKKNQIKNIDISHKTLIETFSIFQITNSQFDYFFI